jgi:hypothetical protein
MSKEEYKKAGLLVARESLAKVGIDEDLLNQKAKEELESEVVHFVRVKGTLMPWQMAKLPAGYKVIRSTIDETLLEHVGPKWETRQKARIDLQKRLGLYPAEDVNVAHSVSELMEEVLSDVMGTSKGKLPSEEVD